MAAYTHDRDGVTAHKAWFFVDGAVICLGAGIQADGDGPVATTIDQAYLASETAHGADGGGRPLEAPYVIADDTRWVLNGRVGYLLLDQNSLTLDVRRKSGAWQAINR